MSKAKEKRIRKELGKLLSAGRYWEWLGAIEREGEIAEHRGEWQEVWQTLGRRAFRDPQKLREFLDQSRPHKVPAEFPDIRFLLLLRQYIDGNENREALASAKGISLPAEAIRKQAFAWDEGAFPRERLRNLLGKLIQTPERITKKDYDNMAAFAEGTELSSKAKTLGEKLSVLRTRRGASSRQTQPWKLKETDHKLRKAAEGLSQPLLRILFHPFLFHMNQRLVQVLNDGEERAVADIVLSMPFLFSLLAGARAEEIENQLRDGRPDRLDWHRFQKVLAQGDLEQKLHLLSQLRSAPQAFETEFEYADAFQDLYGSLLSDIERVQRTLSERERKELGRVMGDLTERDLSSLWLSGAVAENDLAQFLIRAAGAECLGLRLAMLSLILAKKRDNQRLSLLAEKALHSLGRPGWEDMAWLLKQFHDVIFPRVSCLKPLLSFYGPDPPFIEDLAQEIWSKALAGLVLNRLSKRRGLLSFLFEEVMDGENPARDLEIMKKDLASLEQWKPLVLVGHYLHCFPENEMSPSGFGRFLERVLEEGKGMEAIIEMLEKVFAGSQGAGPKPFALPFPVEEFYFMAEKGLLDFLEKHSESLKGVSLGSVDRLIQFLTRKGSYARESKLLFRIANLLEMRSRGGEVEAGALKERLMGQLTQIHSRPKGTRRKKRRHENEELW